MFKSIWKILLVIIIIIVAIYFPFIIVAIGDWLTSVGLLTVSDATLAAFAATIPWWVGAAVGVGLAYVIDPSTTGQLITDVGNVASTVGGVVGSVLGSTASALLSGLLPILIGVGAVWLFAKSRHKDDAGADPTNNTGDPDNGDTGLQPKPILGT